MRCRAYSSGRHGMPQGADHIALVRRQLASSDGCEDVAESLGAFAWIGQRSGLEIDRDTLAHWHGPIDEEGQRRGVLLLRAGFEQGREDVRQFFGELAIETLASRLCQFDSLRPRSTVGIRHRAMFPI